MASLAKSQTDSQCVLKSCFGNLWKPLFINSPSVQINGGSFSDVRIFFDHFSYDFYSKQAGSSLD